MSLSSSRLAFLFVVDGKRLEAQSILLATSLRHHHSDARLFAYMSELSMEGMDPLIDRLFDRLNVEKRLLPPSQGIWRSDYPHGNKLLALAEIRDVDYSIFLDTDMVACRPIDPSDLPSETEVAVVPEGVASWGKEGNRWRRAYAHFGLDLPTEKVRLTRRKRIEFLPYFNAGFVGVREGVRVNGKSFGELWLETAREFDFNARIGGKRPWLDQITLPITMKRFGFDYKLMPVEYNFSVSARAPESDATPIMMHYHRAGFLTAWPQWVQVRRIVMRSLSAEEVGSMSSLLGEFGFLDASSVDAGQDKA